MKIQEIPINIINFTLKNIVKNENIYLIGFLSINDKNHKIDRNNLYIRINETDYSIKFSFKRIYNMKFLSILSNFYIVRIPVADILDFKINNEVLIYYKEKDGTIPFMRNMRYSALMRRRRKYLNSNILVMKNSGTSIYLRKTLTNKLVLTIRKINKTDSPSEQLKLNMAYWISKFYLKRNIILMYEKESMKYEESASVLYEELINQGYRNIYYIIDEESDHVEKIKEKYKSNIIYKHTLKHYIYFFKAKAFIGTESPGHAIDLRIANKKAVRRVYSNKFRYVFLQHGVMYMVSLDSAGRGFFRKGNLMPKNSKIVVSSEEEANHFINLGGYDPEELYITGLPKFDRNVKLKEADKIVIMPTWRPWEYNIVRNNYEESGYYQMIRTIISSIPENLKEKTILMPHPMFVNYLKQTELSNYILDEFIYDDVLKETDTLITDYSSVAFDAFYRGSKVIFWWKDKEECMSNYQGHLMLNKENCFGDVCYNREELSEAINNNYKANQNEKYQRNYKKIVAFSDSNNTKRLIDLLKRDHII